MMKKIAWAMLAASGLLTTPAMAQLDVGGAISGAINGATGGTQASGSAGVGAAGNTNAGSVQNSIRGAVNGALGNNPNGTLPNGSLGAGVQANANSGLNQSANNQTWLGRVSNDLRSAFQPGANGNLQLQGNVNSSLQQYGFQSGDQLLGANGQPLTQAQFDQYLQQNPGQIRVLRNGQTIVLGGNRSQSGQIYGQGQFNANSQGYAQNSMSGRPRFGITMNPSAQGVVVSGVTVGSPAAQAGIRPGDQIVSVNGQEVNTPNDMIQLVGNANANDNLDVQFVRQGREMQSQVVLASAMNARAGGAYQAGYAQGMDGHSGVMGAHGQMSGSFGGAANGNVQQRLDNLERMVQQLRDEIRQQGGQTNNGQADDAPAGTDAPSNADQPQSDQPDNNQSKDDSSK